MIDPSKIYELPCDTCKGTGIVSIEEHWGGPYPIYNEVNCNLCDSGKRRVAGDVILHKITLCQKIIDDSKKEIDSYESAKPIGVNYG